MTVWRHRVQGLVTPKELAARLGISHSTLYGWLRAGAVESPKHHLEGGSRLYYDESDAARIVERFAEDTGQQSRDLAR